MFRPALVTRRGRGLAAAAAAAAGGGGGGGTFSPKAIHFSGASDLRLTTTGSPIDYDADYTLAGWIKVNKKVSGNFQGVCGLWGDADDAEDLELQPQNLMNLNTRVTGVDVWGSSALTVGSWFRISFERSGGATTLQATRSDTVDVSFEDDPPARPTVTSVWFGPPPDREFFALWADLAFWGAWQRTLTETEHAAQRVKSTPVVSGCLAWWPMQGPDDLSDTVGGYDLSASGTVTTVDGPPAVTA